MTMLTKLFLPGLLLLACLMLPGCSRTLRPASSTTDGPTLIREADLVPRNEACRALQPATISRESSAELISYVVAADAAWMTFCKGDKP